FLLLHEVDPCARRAGRRIPVASLVLVPGGIELAVNRHELLHRHVVGHQERGDGDEGGGSEIDQRLLWISHQEQERQRRRESARPARKAAAGSSIVTANPTMNPASANHTGFTPPGCVQISSAAYRATSAANAAGV